METTFKSYISPEGVLCKYRPRTVNEIFLPDDAYLLSHGWQIKEVTTQTNY